MKKFLRPLFNSNIGFFLREKIGFRPPIFLIGNEPSFLSSDLFFWRTDNSYSTIFKASDILNKYYNQESNLILIFFDSYGKFLLKKSVEFHYGMAVIPITTDLIGMKDMGTFIALNVPKEPLSCDVQVTNRCYVGYGKNDSHSMVHGNMTAIKIQPNIKSTDLLQHIKPAVSGRKGNFRYYLQKPNHPSLKMSLIFTNPLDRKVTVAINQKKYEVDSMSCIKVSAPTEGQSVLVESDFVWPRPLVFCEKGKFIDVHHG